MSEDMTSGDAGFGRVRLPERRGVSRVAGFEVGSERRFRALSSEVARGGSSMVGRLAWAKATQGRESAGGRDASSGVGGCVGVWSWLHDVCRGAARAGREYRRAATGTTLCLREQCCGQ